jgi:aconitate hydratase
MRKRIDHPEKLRSPTMLRVLTNKSVRNLLAPDVPPGSTVHAKTGKTMPLWRAAAQYESDSASVVIVAGERYGMGSSRDWAANGTALLGVRAVLASGFERIHRSNLINMGVLPLRLPAGHSPQELGLRPGDTLSIDAEPDRIYPRGSVPVITRTAGKAIRLEAVAAIETSLEIDILKAGGMLPFILGRCVKKRPLQR